MCENVAFYSCKQIYVLIIPCILVEEIIAGIASFDS